MFLVDSSCFQWLVVFTSDQLLFLVDCCGFQWPVVVSSGLQWFLVACCCYQLPVVVTSGLLLLLVACCFFQLTVVVTSWLLLLLVAWPVVVHYRRVVTRGLLFTRLMCYLQVDVLCAVGYMAPWLSVKGCFVLCTRIFVDSQIIVFSSCLCFCSGQFICECISVVVWIKCRLSRFFFTPANQKSAYQAGRCQATILCNKDKLKLCIYPILSE